MGASDPKPYPVPGDGCVVSPYPDGKPLSFSDLSPNEKALFDDYATEQTQDSGTPIDYWIINAVDTIKDPLYAEPIERKFLGPFRMMAVFRAPDQNVTTPEEGIQATFDTTCMIPRATFEALNTPTPGPGDVLHVWNLPIYVSQSTVEPNPLPGAGYYFDVMKADPDGYALDSPTFVRWSLPLKRRTIFTPERRLVRP